MKFVVLFLFNSHFFGFFASDQIQRFDIAFSSLKKFVNFYALDAISGFI